MLPLARNRRRTKGNTPLWTRTLLLSTLQLMIKIARQSFISHSADPSKLPFPPDRRHLADACAYARMRNAHASLVLGPGLGLAQTWRVSGG